MGQGLENQNQFNCANERKRERQSGARVTCLVLLCDGRQVLLHLLISQDAELTLGIRDSHLDLVRLEVDGESRGKSSDRQLDRLVLVVVRLLLDLLLQVTADFVRFDADSTACEETRGRSQSGKEGREECGYEPR